MSRSTELLAQFGPLSKAEKARLIADMLDAINTQPGFVAADLRMMASQFDAEDGTEELARALYDGWRAVSLINISSTAYPRHWANLDRAERDAYLTWARWLVDAGWRRGEKPR